MAVTGDPAPDWRRNLAAVGLLVVTSLLACKTIERNRDWRDEVTFFEREKFTISPGQQVAVVLVIVLSAINSFGIEGGRWVQNIFTVAKTLSPVRPGAYR